MAAFASDDSGMTRTARHDDGPRRGNDRKGGCYYAAFLILCGALCVLAFWVEAFWVEAFWVEACGAFAL